MFKPFWSASQFFRQWELRNFTYQPKATVTWQQIDLGFSYRCRTMDDHVANAKEPMMMEEGTTVKPNTPRRGGCKGCCTSVSLLLFLKGPALFAATVRSKQFIPATNNLMTLGPSTKTGDVCPFLVKICRYLTK